MVFPAALAAIVASQLTIPEKYALLKGSDGGYVGNVGNVSRLSIPSIKLQDAGNGFRTSDARMVGQVTSWPCALALASSWDRELVRAFAESAAEEFVAKGANVVLGPGLNVHRVALGGRNAEYISGEDPVLGSKLADPWIRGFQENGVIATAKHFVLNNQETHRGSYSARVSERTLKEVYMPPFEAAAMAGVGSAMCSYNRVNGTYACENFRTLSMLKSVLPGWVMSDWGATHSTSVVEGLDQDMPGWDSFFSPLNLATQVPMEAIDESVSRILDPLFRVAPRRGCTVPGNGCDRELYEVNASTPAHSALAEKIAVESVLLLKNDDDVLPLSRDLRVGIVGSACNAPNNISDMYARDVGNYYVVGGSGRVVPDSVITVVDGMKAAGYGNIQTSFTDSAEDAAELDVDAYVACAGATSVEAQDRSSLSLDQEAFLEKVVRLPQPTVVVALAPGAVVLPFSDQASAILVIFFGGKFTGSSVARIVSGASSPSAKSPISFPLFQNDTILPCLDQDCPYEEGLEVGYKNGKPVAFPFGHGLTFTTFEYYWIAEPVEQKNDTVATRARIVNVGNRSGVETPQIYVLYPEISGEPMVPQLKDFQKTVDLAPGGYTDISFLLPLDSLRIYDGTLVKGTYHFYIGASSRDLRLNSTLSLS